MSFSMEEAIESIDEITLSKRGSGLSEPETAVLRAAWQNLTYDEIAAEADVSVSGDYLSRNVAPKLWTFLSETLGHQIKKNTLRSVLVRQANRKARKSQAELIPILGGQLPVIERFYGYGVELEALRKYLHTSQYVEIAGPTGAGKSSLAATVIEQIAEWPHLKFDCVIWKSIYYPPPLSDLVAELLALLGASAEVGDSPQAQLTLLLEQLRQRRVLLVLDGAESLLWSDRTSSNNLWESSDIDYGLLFRRLVEEQHNSCLLVTTCEEPLKDLKDLQEKGYLITRITLNGIDAAAARLLLKDSNLTDDDVLALNRKYRGNPLALKMMVTIFDELFDSSVDASFGTKTTWIGDIFRRPLNAQLSTKGPTSDLERQIMIYLAQEIEHGIEPVSVGQLLNALKNKMGITTSQSLEAINRLNKRFLVEKIEDVDGKILLGLRPVVKKYVLQELCPPPVPPWMPQSA